jgi:hypothetical protein
MDIRLCLRPILVPTLLLLSSCGFVGGDTDGTPKLAVGPGDDLQAILDTVRGPIDVDLAPGDYHLDAVAFTDPTCGNCESADEPVPATRGLRLSGRDIHLRGSQANQTVIHTHAGYGVMFDECEGCSLSGITVTDGIRDPDGRATDAGVVVRGGDVTLADCTIRDNLGDSAVVHSVVVGVAGVAVREDATVTVERCLIERNSWDGIAAYRGARLIALDNVVDGVDKASGAALGGGRGVGIGLTWDAQARIEGNLVTRYWKGIGVFVNARAEVSTNVVEDILTWGIAYWGPDQGRPIAWIHDNAVFETGACGASVDRTAPFDADEARPSSSDAVGLPAPEGPGALRNNVFVRTGQNERYDTGEPYCLQRPIARHAVPEGFSIGGNIVHDVRQPGTSPRDSVVDRATLSSEARELIDGIAGKPHLAASRFYGAFGEPPRS